MTSSLFRAISPLTASDKGRILVSFTLGILRALSTREISFLIKFHLFSPRDPRMIFTRLLDVPIKRLIFLRLSLPRE